MKDRLEEFMNEHRAEFDLHDPDPKLWKDIEKEISRKKIVSWKFYLARTAIVLAIFGASVVAQRLWLNSNTRIARNTNSKNTEIPELREAEVYYTGVINEKLREVEPLLAKYPSLDHEMHVDLSQLDSVYTGLKNDLKDNIANQEVIEAMIQNYRLRISILEDMLNFTESKISNDTVKKYRI
jgi:hypothetical protein